MQNLGCDVRKIGFFLGDFPRFDKDEIEITHEPQWQQICKTILSLPEEEVMPIDFKTRNVMLIRGTVDKVNRFVFVDHVAGDDNTLRVFVACMEDFLNWLREVPVTVVLAISYPADKEIHVCRQSGYMKPEQIPAMSALRNQSQKTLDELFKIQSAMEMMGQYQPLDPVGNLQQKFAELNKARLDIIHRISQFQMHLRSNLMGPQL